MENWAEQQAYFKRLEDRAKRMAQAGMATNSKVMTRKAGVMFARIEREKEKMSLKRPYKARKFNIDFREQDKGGKNAIEVSHLKICTENGRMIVDDASFSVGVGERVFMIGNNGSGKTSILKTILGEQELSYQGDIIVSPNVQLGYLPQIINFRNNKQQVLDYFQHEVGIGEERARSIAHGCKNNHLHETEESVYVEVINPDENGFGNYIITSLINRAMPLIRYDIGDIGNIVENTCDCGKKGRILNIQSGRTCEFYQDINKKVPAYFFARMLMDYADVIDSNFLVQFHVIQSRIDLLEYYIEVNTFISEDALTEFLKEMFLMLHWFFFQNLTCRWDFYDMNRNGR